MPSPFSSLVAITMVGLSASSVESAANTTSGAATFGDITSGTDKCVVGTPTSTSPPTLWIGSGRTECGPQGQIQQERYEQQELDPRPPCEEPGLTQLLRPLGCHVGSPVQGLNKWLVGYDCWPYNDIKVNIVGWATRDASLFEWTDDWSMGATSMQTVCRSAPSPVTASTMLGSVAGPGLDGGMGYDWGQEVNMENMMATLDDEELTVVAHNRYPKA
ncbi:hypothetical protein V7S43_016466 [Phytophthora oleae]|uniref:Uncharacterized protein n=1 Tax=Phytophthora oleae TaxID=2107226 RepID=A0ABD3EY01_9STRA